MIPVGWLAPSGCWDQNLIELLTSNRLYETGLEFRHLQGFPPPNQAEGCILSIPGAYWHDQYDKINEALTRYRWVLGMCVSDEESLFDISRVEHGNILWWQQCPRADRSYGDARLFGVGFPPHFNDVARDVPEKDLDVFLSGQWTHARRAECFEALMRTPATMQGPPAHFVNATDGFTKGMDPAEYATYMSRAKVAPCPSGAVSPDSFRFWEALEAHCVPIADDVSPKYLDEEAPYFSAGFWRSLFEGPLPFPVLTNYADLPGYIQDVLSGWPANANRVAAWWARYKRELTLWLETDLKALGAL